MSQSGEVTWVRVTFFSARETGTTEPKDLTSPTRSTVAAGAHALCTSRESPTRTSGVDGLEPVIREKAGLADLQGAHPTRLIVRSRAVATAGARGDVAGTHSGREASGDIGVRARCLRLVHLRLTIELRMRPPIESSLRRTLRRACCYRTALASAGARLRRAGSNVLSFSQHHPLPPCPDDVCATRAG